MNLLLVDDQISVLDGLKSSIPFSRYGIRKIFTATNADDARAVIQSHPVDLMLSDIEMPGENGLSLNKWVKEHYPAILLRESDWSSDVCSYDLLPTPLSATHRRV